MKNLFGKLGSRWRRIIGGVAVLVIFVMPAARNLLSNTVIAAEKNAKGSNLKKSHPANGQPANRSRDVRTVSRPSSGPAASPKSNTHSNKNDFSTKPNKPKAK